jgi:LmbE family N-acetylglucosaminyl deacetylase
MPVPWRVSWDEFAPRDAPILRFLQLMTPWTAGDELPTPLDAGYLFEHRFRGAVHHHVTGSPCSQPTLLTVRRMTLVSRLASNVSVHSGRRPVRCQTARFSRSLLPRVRYRSCMPGTLAAVVAHPDDDAYGIAALVALHAEDPGFRFVLVHATDGDAGAIADGSGARRADLGAMRREEDRRAWITLGRSPDRHEWFGYPDGGLAAVPYDELVGRIATVLDEERPDVVATFGPDGITGHPDHIAIGRAATEAFLRFAGDGGRGFRRLVYGGIRQSVIDRWNHRRLTAGLPAWDPDTVYHLRGVPDDSIDIDVDTSSVAPLVRAAMLEHRTQWNDLNSPDVPRSRPARTLSDVFEDL